MRSGADIDRFFAERRAKGHSSAVSASALAALLGFVRDRQVIGAPAAEAETPAGRLLADYRRYLRADTDLRCRSWPTVPSGYRRVTRQDALSAKWRDERAGSLETLHA